MKTDLNNLKCAPCSGKTPKLVPQEISNYLSQLSGWSVNDEQEMSFKNFKFTNCKKALEFTNLVGKIAEFEGHHPDISLGWGYAIVMLNTHAIKGLSVNDFIIALKIDKLNN